MAGEGAIEASDTKARLLPQYQRDYLGRYCGERSFHSWSFWSLSLFSLLRPASFCPMSRVDAACDRKKHKVLQDCH